MDTFGEPSPLLKTYTGALWSATKSAGCAAPDILSTYKAKING